MQAMLIGEEEADLAGDREDAAGCGVVGRGEA
jgi:hypothetical protein